MIKKYKIHILAVTAISAETFDLPAERNAIIVCCERINRFVYQCSPENTLILDFPDVEDKKFPGAFNRAHARRIIGFIENLSEQVTDLYVCCSKGGSRSTAVAAALMRMSIRSDKDVWENPFYVPNTLVYYTLCKEYGLHITKLSVLFKKWKNDMSYRRSQKGKPCKYERWQILE